jgi:hypothetical protein
MPRPTIGDVTSRLRNLIKAVKQDAFVTDRMLYSFFIKHAKYLMKLEDSKNKLLSVSSVIQTLDFVELVEIDKVEACCTGIKSDCKIKRTKDKLPTFMQGYYGPLIRTVSSLDNSEELQPIFSTSYIQIANSKNYKYNKTKYFWFLDDYLYFPNLEWDAVRIEGIFEDDISMYTCEEDSCIVRRDQPINVPDFMFYQIDSLTLRDLYALLQIPSDIDIDKQNLNR